MKIVITGGSGFVGSKLCELLIKEGHSVTIIGHSPPRKEMDRVSFVKANLMEGEVPSIFGECDAIVHLAGAPIFHRWTESYKRLILDSRVKTAKAIYQFLSQSKQRPKVFVSASASGFYGDRGDTLLDESAAEGRDFLASVCTEWEKAAENFSSLGMRAVEVRTATVLGPGGGALAKMIPLFRLGLGGKLGTGKQWFPWIHLEDLSQIYVQAITNPRLSGPINAVAPETLRNRDFTQALGHALKRPAILPAPAFALRLVFGELAEALLTSQKVIPKKLEQLGFHFSYPTMKKALSQIF